MSIDNIQKEFKNKVSEEIRLHPEGIDRFRVFTPFRYDDGDHLVIILRKDLDDNWILSDTGNTFMHLSYDLEEASLFQGTRQTIIQNTLGEFSVEDRAGELILEIPGSEYGNALYDFIQAMLRINDVTYLTRERVKSTFMEDFKTFIEESVPENRRQFNWHHQQLDPSGSYSVDCRINKLPRPLMIFALPNDNLTRDATISLLKFESWNLDYRSMSIFENQEEINRKVLARFSDVCEKQYSNLYTNKNRISQYLEEIIKA